MLADMAAQMQQLKVDKEELQRRNTLLESLLKVATQVQIKLDFSMSGFFWFGCTGVLPASYVMATQLNIINCNNNVLISYILCPTYYV